MTLNAPTLWRQHLPVPVNDGHKYKRGHALIVGSECFTGATRLASEACSRIGAGLVTVWSETHADIYRVTLPADLMIAEQSVEGLRGVNTVLAGSGGCTDQQAEIVFRTFEDATFVLDADALRFLERIERRTCVLTPHEGEFERFIGPLGPDKTETAAAVANEHGCIVVLKGAQTIIAAPDGRVVTNETASPYLAKAGTGDVLAGLITGLVTQHMPAFEAACAGVWIHGHAGKRIGPGLLPQDIMLELRAILRELFA
ncbi:MAG: NAD(P)H-hydrate dehydratase [Pseudomonadota bacterium]